MIIPNIDPIAKPNIKIMVFRRNCFPFSKIKTKHAITPTILPKILNTISAQKIPEEFAKSVLYIFMKYACNQKTLAEETKSPNEKNIFMILSKLSFIAKTIKAPLIAAIETSIKPSANCIELPPFSGRNKFIFKFEF
jgi:hypothetical protein